VRVANGAAVADPTAEDGSRLEGRMRSASLAFASVLALAFAAPCLAQSLEVSKGAPVSVESVHVEASVEEGVARVEVEETFRNRTDRAQEGVYRMKLPEDAVICAFSMWMNGQEKQGRVLEARQARAVYDSIVAKKRDPGLLEQIGWREFRVNVFPIPARDVVRVKLVYAHVLRDDLGLETLEIPLPERSGVVGEIVVHAKVTSAGGLSGVDCPSMKDAKIAADENCADLRWTGDGVEPRGPFVMRSMEKRAGFDVQLLAHRPPGAAEGWFVARVVPHLAAPPKIPRDVVFVVDRSGSMEGKKMDQARAALLAGLATLRPEDQFDVISFSSDVTSLGDGRLLAATPENLERARHEARDLTASGGTNIAGALSAALAARSADLSRFSAIVFLTDGDPTVGEMRPDAILSTWRATSGATRLFAFGVGNDVHDFLLTKLAVEGRGDARYVREDEDLEVKLGALFDRVRTPLLLDPTFDVESETVTALDREPRRLPDLFQGRALVVSGRFTGAGKAKLRLRGRCGADAVSIDVPVEFPAETADRPYVAQIWAKARVERLLDDLRVAGGSREIRDEVLRLGLRHQLVTPYTSFLVVEDGVRIPDPGDSARLPNVPPGADAERPIIDRNAIPRVAESGPANPDEIVIADAEPGDFNPDPDAPANLPGGATGSTSIGVGHFGTGRPSAFASRRAGAGGSGGGGLGQGGGGGTGGATKQTETSVMWALRWLKDHQSPDGRWSSAGFDAQCKLNHCDGPGADGRDVRATGLALLAFLGAGETHQSGTCKETVKNALKWLRDVQDSDGCVGPRTNPTFLRDHAVAALALTETFGMTSSRAFKEPAQKAVAFALATRAPGGAWRNADGSLDVETTGWMTMTLRSAALSELADAEAIRSAIAQAFAELDKASDAATPDLRAAVWTLSRVYDAATTTNDATFAKRADAVASKGPTSDATDATYGYFATLAMFQTGGERWRKWNDAMKTALVDHQRADIDRDERGSWDPVGVGASDLGRLGVTAIECLDLEAYYRYPRVTTMDPTPRPTTDGK